MDIPASVAGIVEDETSVIFKILGIPWLSEPSEQERNAAAISSETWLYVENVAILAVFKHNPELTINLIEISHFMILKIIAFEISVTSHTVSILQTSCQIQRTVARYYFPKMLTCCQLDIL